MKLHDLKPAPGSRSQPKRVGRGTGSGLGKTSGRGHKGQKSRSGGGVRRGFEGGQMPLTRRIPKFGFTNIFAKKMAIVNLEDLNRFEEGLEVTPQVMKESGILKSLSNGVKVLGRGDLEKPLTVKAQGFSKQAREKIEQAGGKAEVM